MKIVGIDIYQYYLPLNFPLYVRGKKLDKREGLLIHFQSDQKAEGFGEIAPLPGVNHESVEEARQQIQRFKLHLLNQMIPHHIEKLNGKFSTWLDPFNLKPSVRCGIEMAVLNLMANAHQMSLSQLLSSSSHDHICLNGLVEGSQEEVEHQVTQLMKDGFTAIKLKVGGHVDDDIKKIKTVNQIIDGRAILHLDANQQWDFDQAIEFGKKIGPATTDYIEEPFRDLSRIPEFFQETLIPVALDESITHKDFDEIKSIEGVDFLILKPTVLGGIEKTWNLMNEAKKFGLETIISSSFESSVGILTLAQLAGTSSHHNMAGLDTLKYFQKNLLKDELITQKGKIYLADQTIKTQNICFHLLTKSSTS